MGLGKLSLEDRDELSRITPDKLDGVLWEDRVRVSKLNRGGCAVKRTSSGLVLARFSLIDEALAYARRKNRRG